MADNFDINVARRKPNVLRKSRPSHPWDVPVAPAGGEGAGDSAAGAVSSPEKDEHVSAAPGRSGSSSARAAGARVSAPARPADLSDSINIHSNFCKLDNDVSDILFPHLSTSAQSVYLRLYRQSFGWNRNWAAESLPKLSKACNLSLQTVRKAIKELEGFGCIRKEFSDYHKATVYRVFLPSEIDNGIISASDNRRVRNRGLNIDTQKKALPAGSPQKPDPSGGGGQAPDIDNNYDAPVKYFTGGGPGVRGQDSAIQSIYFSGTSVYNILESGGALPKNISKHMNDTDLAEAVETIDGFYDSIGFSVVSRAVYRKSLVDYFELIKAGFSHDDIRYAVRWTFRNSRTRPGSFSLIKHTMHLAMDDLIRELKAVSGDREAVERRKEAVARSAGSGGGETPNNISGEDFKRWLDVVDELKKNLNSHSFRAFIEPLRLLSVEGETVRLNAPPDSLSWIVDHYHGIIEKTYREKTGGSVSVEIV